MLRIELPGRRNRGKPKRRFMDAAKELSGCSDGRSRNKKTTASSSNRALIVRHLLKVLMYDKRARKTLNVQFVEPYNTP